MTAVNAHFCRDDADTFYFEMCGMPTAGLSLKQAGEGAVVSSR